MFGIALLECLKRIFRDHMRWFYLAIKRLPLRRQNHRFAGSVKEVGA